MNYCNAQGRKSGSRACIRAKPLFLQHLIFLGAAVEISVNGHGTKLVKKEPREQLRRKTIYVNYSISTGALDCRVQFGLCNLEQSICYAIYSWCAMQSAIQFLESDAILSTMQLRQFSAASAELRSRLHQSRSPPANLKHLLRPIKIRPHFHQPVIRFYSPRQELSILLCVIKYPAGRPLFQILTQPIDAMSRESLSMSINAIDSWEYSREHSIAV